MLQGRARGRGQIHTHTSQSGTGRLAQRRLRTHVPQVSGRRHVERPLLAALQPCSLTSRFSVSSWMGSSL
jgi:hypothetical protein